MKILVGLDDSPFSEQAIEFVAKMRWPAGSTVLAVSAVPPFYGAYAEPYVPESWYSSDVVTEQVKFHQEIVDRAGKRLCDAGLATGTRVLEGDPRDCLVALAASERFDLIVVGSHGRTGVAKLLLGSVASHIVGHAHCSVLVVKKNGR